jgi:hypothetical protein
MASSVQAVFHTAMPEAYQVPTVQVDLATSSGIKELTQIVKQLLSDDGKGEDIKNKKLNFIVKDVFLTGTL